MLVYGLLLGAGIPLVFAFGIRALAFGNGGEATDAHGGVHPVGRALAGLCFALVLVAVALGITVIVAAGDTPLLEGASLRAFAEGRREYLLESPGLKELTP